MEISSFCTPSDDPHGPRPTAFGTLMAVEPGFAVLLGALVLHQTPSPAQVAGIALVVIAGAGAQRGGIRGDRGTMTRPETDLAPLTGH